MKIAMATDHAGTAMKKEIMAYLIDQGHEVVDFGTYDEASCDLSDFVYPAALAVGKGECERGILVCGTGIGITVAANRFKGIRAANCVNTFMAKACRQHNDANILGLGSRVIGTGTAMEILKAFLETPFSEGERHLKRIRDMDELV